MAFRERLELIVDVVTGNSSGNIKNLKSSLEDTDGAFSNMGKTADGAFGTVKSSAGGAFDSVKSSASGAFDNVKGAASGVFDNISQNIAGFALAGAGALAGFAVKAIGDFQETALGAASLRDSLGVTAEEASRLQEVAGDLGIPIGALETSIGRMNRTAASSPAAFDEIGAAIARNKDGTTNTTETYLNVIDALNRIEDPAKRAAAAQKILGKSWMDSAELIQLGADGVREAMASVEEAKIIDDKEIAQAREFRDMLDGLKGTIESVSLTVGQTLVPVLSDAGSGLQDVIGPLQDLKKAYEDLTNIPGIKQVYDLAPWNQLQTRWEDAGRVAQVLTGQADDMSASYNQAASEAAHLAREEAGVAQVADDLTGVLDGQIPALQAVVSNETAAGVQADILAEAQRIAADGAEKLNEQLLAQVDALNEQIDALRTSADSTIAADEAQEDFVAAAKKTVEVMKDAESSAEDLDDAVDGERDAMIAAADAAVKLADDQAKAAGSSQTATQKVDTFNDSLLSNAQFATPAARDAIADYINEANGVPAEKATEIKAAIARGDLAEAKRLLDEASVSREAAIRAEATNLTATRQALDKLAEDRRANIVTYQVAGGAVVAGKRAKGGPVKKGAPYLVGEEGPEVVVPNQSGTVIPNGGDGGGSPLAAGGGATSITINMAPGADGADIVRAIKRYERYNGNRWRP